MKSRNLPNKFVSTISKDWRGKDISERMCNYFSSSTQSQVSKVESCCLTYALMRAQLHISRVWLWDPKDPSSHPTGSSVHGFLQARILEWVAISSSRGSSQPKNQTHVSHIFCIAGRFFTYQATWEALYMYKIIQILGI